MAALKRRLSDTVSTTLKVKSSPFHSSVKLYEIKPEPAGTASELATLQSTDPSTAEDATARVFRRSTRVRVQIKNESHPIQDGPENTGDEDLTSRRANANHLRRRKRVKIEETMALVKPEEQEEEMVLLKDGEELVHAESSSTVTAAGHSTTRVKATATAPKKRKPIPQALDTPHPAPERWKEVYDIIKDMRSKIVAPVDTMGCDQAQWKETDPKNQRFATLVSLMLSSQTKDEVTDAAVSALREALGGALNVEAMIAAEEATISKAIAKVGFWRRKTQYLKQTAEKLRDEFDSDVPKTVDELCSLPGVGPKMAFLALQVAWNLNVGIGVDVHVHRITNRLGWHKRPTKSPEETRLNLQSWLPSEYHREINHMLVGFGQVICLPVGPRCDSCELSSKGLCPSARSLSMAKSKLKSKSKSRTPGPKVEIQLEE